MKTSELKKMTVKQLRELAKDDSSIIGATAMKKDELVEALSEEDDTVQEKGTSGPISKDQAKSEIVRLKDKMARLSEGDSKNVKQLKNIRRRIRNLKRNLRATG